MDHEHKLKTIIETFGHYRGSERVLEAVDYISKQSLSDDDIIFIAINIKERYHNRDLCAECLKFISNRENPSAWALYELAIIYANIDCQASFNYLHRSLQVRPRFSRCAALYLRMAALRGKQQEIERCAATAEVNTYNEIEEGEGEFLDHLRYISSFLEWKSDEEGLFGVKGIDISLSKLVTAKLSASKSSFIRLGDGEGSFFEFDEAEERANRAAYEEMRTYFSTRWLGEGTQTAQSFLMGCAHLLVKNLPEFDVIGIPDQGWLLSNLVQGNRRGFTGLINVYRKIAEIREKLKKDVIFTNTSAVHDIIHDGNFLEFTSRSAKKHIISSNTKIDHKEIFNDSDLIVHYLPPASSDVLSAGGGSPHMTLKDAVSGFADQTLSTSPGDTIFLCSGFISKCLISTLVRTGRSVVDIGSALDVSLGRKIR